MTNATCESMSKHNKDCALHNYTYEVGSGDIIPDCTCAPSEFARYMDDTNGKCWRQWTPHVISRYREAFYAGFGSGSRYTQTASK